MTRKLLFDENYDHMVTKLVPAQVKFPPLAQCHLYQDAKSKGNHFDFDFDRKLIEPKLPAIAIIFCLMNFFKEIKMS